MTDVTSRTGERQAVRGSLSLSAKPGGKQTLSWTQRAARAALMRQLRRLRWGLLVLEDCDGRRELGDSTAPDALRATVTIVDPAAYVEIAVGGTIGAGEAFMDGRWTTDRLGAVTRILVRNRHVMDAMDSAMARAASALLKRIHERNANTRDGSRRNIQAHYDLGNEFFALFLDETMAYSSGIFTTPTATLHDASIAKFDAICGDLGLAPGLRVMEIGTGWGGFALHAAAKYGCHVTTTTISQRQFEWARSRVRQAGLADRVEVLLRDYRDLSGTYDRLVSIEMIEAVGHEFYDTYFAKCGELLAPGGSMSLQAITIQHEFYEQAKNAVDFIQRYVFPGSCIPSEPVIEESALRAGGLRVVARRDITEHYVTTLQTWCERLLARADDARALGHDDAFLRLWEFYFRYCEGGFAERQIEDVQLVLAKGPSGGA